MLPFGNLNYVASFTNGPVKLHEREALKHINLACNYRDPETDDMVDGHVSKVEIPVFPPSVR